jgi:hypothetical protein
MSAPVVEIGRIIDATSPSPGMGLGSYIPIYSLDEIALSRGQNWKVDVGISSFIVIWQGSQKVSYAINFELLVGWGDIQSISQLNDAVALFHALCSPVLAGSNGQGRSGTISPPAVRLMILGQVNMLGILEDVKTVFKPPWVTDPGQTQVTGMSCQFSGTFTFVPGLGTDGQIVAVICQQDLSYASVKTNLYDISA